MFGKTNKVFDKPNTFLMGKHIDKVKYGKPYPKPVLNRIPAGWVNPEATGGAGGSWKPDAGGITNSVNHYPLLA